jgi:serpin B
MPEPMKRFAAIILMSWTGLSGGAAASTGNTADAVVKANTAFATALYRKEKDKAGNLFFSPYSVSTALAMTSAGARGQTAAEMARVLHFDSLSPAALAKAFGGLARDLKKSQTENLADLALANSVWCQQDVTLKPEFSSLVKDVYGAEAKSVDFLRASEDARRKINDWVARETRDKIKDLLQPRQISPQTLLVLANAIYFKSQWASRFQAAATHPAPFFTAPGRQVETPMMSQSLKLRSGEFDQFSLFALPYTSNALSMIILLPREVDGLPRLEQQLTSHNLIQWLTDLDRQPELKATVFLPKFKLDCRLELTRDLAAMGMPTAFGAGADFSGMSTNQGVSISDVVHQAFVEVNEEGTEAAAAIAVVMKRTALERPPTIFRADHPFLFLIRENRTGSILFLGRLTEPK